MIKLFYKYPILSISLLVSFIFLSYLYIFSSSKYKSSSIISISYESSSPSISSLGIVSNLLGSGIDQSIDDLKNYLESDEASVNLSNLIDVDRMFSSSEIDYFSRYKPNSRLSFKDYLENIINLKSDGGKTLEIETFAFSPEDAYRLNLAIILMSSNYFDKRQNLSSKVALIQNLCQYDISSEGINIQNLDTLDLGIQIKEADISESLSANDLLFQKAELFNEFCINKKGKDLNTIKIPEDILRTVNSNTLQQLISEIYKNSISMVTMSNAIDVIAEPIKSKKPINKFIALRTIIVLFFSILFFTTVRIILNLKDDFKI